MSEGIAECVFLGWDGPAVERVADWLIASVGSEGPVDLADCWVVAPTRQSGRRLREAVARRAGAAGRGVLAPAYLTPESLLARVPSASQIAGNEEALLAWLSVLRSLEIEQFRSLLPGLRREDCSFEWARGFARDLAELRGLLGENGFDFAAVAEHPEMTAERERWRDLARIEDAYRRRLGAAGLLDREDARRAALGAPPPSELRRIVIAGVPDPMPLALDLVRAWSDRVRVDVVVLAPESEAEAFDAWGRPRDLWCARALGVADSSLHVAATQREQAAAIVALAARYRSPARTISLAVGDRDSGLLVAHRLRDVGQESYFPDGEPFAASEWGVFLASLAELLQSRSIRAVVELLRQPLGAIAAGLREPAEVEQVLAQLDDQRMRRIPDTLDDLAGVQRQPLASALGRLDALLSKLQSGAPMAALMDALERPAKARIGQMDREAAGRFREAVKILDRAMAALAQAHDFCGDLSAAEWLGILIDALGRERTHTGRSDNSLALQGWLEVAWDPAPHAVVADFVDGVVPENVRGHLFLPDGAREKLGMRCNRTRHARDAYVLEFLLHAKQRVDIHVPRVNAAGDPLAPSRLLLQIGDDALVARARLLFAEPAQARHTPAFRHAWKLEPPRLAIPQHLSVTAFRAYLSCPFRFYLANVAGMQTFDTEAMEMDAMAFGTLAHRVLEQFANDEQARDGTSAADIAAYFERALDEVVARRFGRNLSVSLTMQLESLRRRLARAAERQAAWRQDGWRIVRAEARFEDFGAFAIEGMPIAGRIDRIDFNEALGVYCLIDYKTSDTATNPAKAHIVTARHAEKLALACPSGDGEGCWCDLQLPLYCMAAAVAPDFKGRFTAAYFNLPKSLDGVGISEWADIEGELESARACAAAVVRNIRAGVFWPPSEHVRDDFERLFFNSVVESVSGAPEPVRAEVEQ